VEGSINLYNGACFSNDDCSKVYESRENISKVIPIKDRVSMDRNENVFGLRVDPQSIEEVSKRVANKIVKNKKGKSDNKLSFCFISSFDLYSVGLNDIRSSSAIPVGSKPFLFILTVNVFDSKGSTWILYGIVALFKTLILIVFSLFIS